MISIGNIHYNWLVSQHYRPERLLLHIFPLNNPEKQLEVEILGKQDTISAKYALECLEYALRKNWGAAAFFQMKMRIEGTSIQILPYLFGDAQHLAAAVTQYSKSKPQAAFQQQLNKQELEDAELSLQLKFPYLFKELYIQNGTVGGWGPDSGFFPITPNTGYSIMGSYRTFRKQVPAKKFWEANPNYLAFLHWGTDVYSLLDCSSALGAVYAFDENLKKSDNNWDDCCWLVNESLYNWIQYWLETDTYGVALWRNMYEAKGLLT